MRKTVKITGLIILSALLEVFAEDVPATRAESYPSIDNQGKPLQSAVIASATASATNQTAFSLESNLSLDRAIEIALANNPSVATVRHEVHAADAQYDMAVGDMLPKLDLTGSHTVYRDIRIINPRRPGLVDTILFSDQLLSADFVLRMPLFTGGKLINEVRAAKLMRLSAEHRLARTREELVFNVSSVFYSILSQEHVIESLEFSQTALREHLRRVGNLIEAQKAAIVDQLRTEVRLADLAHELATERNVMAIQSRVLINLMGVRKSSDSPLLIAGEFEGTTGEVPDEEISVVNALNDRNDYLAAQSALEAQAKRVAAARAGHSPNVVLDAAYGDNWDAYHTNDHNEVGTITLGISIPIYAGGKIRAKVRHEQANLLAAQDSLRDHELQIRLEVETAILNVSSSLERVKASEKSIEQAKESLRIEREKYDFAKGSITDVLDAQSELLDSQMNYYRALADYSTALAYYRLAVGEDQ